MYLDMRGIFDHLHKEALLKEAKLAKEKLLAIKHSLYRTNFKPELKLTFLSELEEYELTFFDNDIRLFCKFKNHNNK